MRRYWTRDCPGSPGDSATARFRSRCAMYGRGKLLNFDSLGELGVREKAGRFTGLVATHRTPMSFGDEFTCQPSFWLGLICTRLSWPQGMTGMEM